MSVQIDDADGALWSLYIEEETVDVETTIYKFTDKVILPKGELGFHKYHILTFKPTDTENTIEFMKAHIGDVKRFIDNHAKAGYNGVMVKEGCMPKRAIKDLIKLTFKNWHIPNHKMKPILAQV